MEGIGFVECKAIATENIIWAHLECVLLVFEQALLDVNLAETFDVYSVVCFPVQ